MTGLDTECEYRFGNHDPVVKNLARIVLFSVDCIAVSPEDWS